MDDNQTIPDEPVGSVENEGDNIAITDDSAESVDNEQVTETPVQPKKPLDGIIEKQARLYAEAGEDERDDILSKYPKIKSKVKKLGDSLVDDLYESEVADTEDHDVNSIAEKAAEILEQKAQDKILRSLLVKNNVKGEQNFNKLMKAATSLLKTGFTPEDAVKGVLAAGTKSAQPTIPRSGGEPAPEAKGKKQPLIQKPKRPTDWYK